MCAPWVTQHTSIRYSSSCHTRVNMGESIFFTAAMIRAFRSARSRGLVCRRVLCVLCTKCTLHSNHRDLLVWYSHTQNDFSPGAAICSLHTLASHSGRNMNYDEKQFTGRGGKKLSCSFYPYRFRKYVPYVLPITNSCNPGLHYVTPCIYSIDYWQYNGDASPENHKYQSRIHPQIRKTKQETMQLQWQHLF